MEETKITFGTRIYSTLIFDVYTIENIRNFIHTVKIWRGPSTSNGKFSLYNREKNEMKVNEIFESILDNTLTPNIIHISEIYDRDDKQQQLRCWDGQHRWHAIRKFYIDKHNKDISNMFMCFIYKNDNNDGALEKFINHNKLSPAPIPDINPHPEPASDVIKIIEMVKELIEFIISAFPKMQSISNKPKKGNYNVNKLYNILYNFIEEENIIKKNISCEYIKQKIIEHNNKLKDFYTDKYKSIIKDANIKRAFENNCFLFLLDDFTTSLNLTEETHINKFEI